MKKTGLIFCVILITQAASDLFAYYDAQRGRFISRDPLATNTRPIRIGDLQDTPNPMMISKSPQAIERDPIDSMYPDGPNLFQYAMSNPALHVDNSGLSSANWSAKLRHYTSRPFGVWVSSPSGIRGATWPKEWDIGARCEHTGRPTPYYSSPNSRPRLITPYNLDTYGTLTAAWWVENPNAWEPTIHELGHAGILFYYFYGAKRRALPYENIQYCRLSTCECYADIIEMIGKLYFYKAAVANMNYEIYWPGYPPAKVLLAIQAKAKFQATVRNLDVKIIQKETACKEKYATDRRSFR